MSQQNSTINVVNFLDLANITQAFLNKYSSHEYKEAVISCQNGKGTLEQQNLLAKGFHQFLNILLDIYKTADDLNRQNTILIRTNKELEKQINSTSYIAPMVSTKEKSSQNSQVVDQCSLLQGTQKETTKPTMIIIGPKLTNNQLTPVTRDNRMKQTAKRRIFTRVRPSILVPKRQKTELPEASHQDQTTFGVEKSKILPEDIINLSDNES